MTDLPESGTVVPERCTTCGADLIHGLIVGQHNQGCALEQAERQAMTDLGESKAVPERWREVYDNYKPKEGVFEPVERVQGRYWCHRAVEELGTAEYTTREQAQTIERLTKALERVIAAEVSSNPRHHFEAIEAARKVVGMKP